jgi:hypothetical protein
LDGMGCGEKKKGEEMKRQIDIETLSWHGCRW